MDAVVNSQHMKELLTFLNTRPWSDGERGDACAALVAAYVLNQEGRGATKTWTLDLTVKAQRAKVKVMAICDPDLETIANG
jgi:hypothetical protein